MKRLLPALLLLLLTAAPAFAAKPLFANSVRPLQALVPVASAEELAIMQMGFPIKPSQLAIRNICTITSIDAKRHFWLTAAHCVGDLEKKALDLLPRYVDNRPASVVEVSYEKDLAILQTPDYSVPSVKLSSQPPDWMQRLIIAGHPFGYQSLFVTQGWVANPVARLDPDDAQLYMLMNVPAAPGNSGSCVFNLKGEVVSVLQVGWGRGFSPVSGGSTYWNLRTFALKYFGR
jgi:S1-C subfamily serine protease